MKKETKIAIRTVELSQPVHTLTDVVDYSKVHIFVCWKGQVLGGFDIDNKGQSISAARLRQEIAQKMTLKILSLETNLSDDAVYSEAMTAMAKIYGSGNEENESLNHIIDISKNFRPIKILDDREELDIPVYWQNRYLGNIQICAHNRLISVTRLRDVIVETFGLQLLEPCQNFNGEVAWSKALVALTERYGLNGSEPVEEQESLPEQVPVSIVVATRDRPENLRNCLQSLITQKSTREIEIIVVDNNPASGLTPPVLAEFPGVCLVEESRKGLSYARNAGFAACKGEIAVATDDDVIAPPEWLERIVAPFARKDVMIVTGNVLPYEMESRAQQLFELYGGLSRGYERFEAATEWFESFKVRAVPTWELGATASAAFRSSIFSHPQIGMLHEALGVGMPAGCSEDTYLFYKVLKAGYSIVYEPAACVWHKHRMTMKALRKQLYNYSKGGVAYHLLTFLHAGDFRGLVRIFAELPLIHLWRMKEWLMRKSEYPPTLVLLEILGNLVGPIALYRGWLRVKRQGRSEAYVNVCQRSNGRAAKLKTELAIYNKTASCL